MLFLLLLEQQIPVAVVVEPGDRLVRGEVTADQVL
jgi:hypothetical protein